MRNFEDMRPQLSTLMRALERYVRVSRMAFDFGVGELLHPAEIHMVSLVVEKGGLSISDMAEHFGNTKGAASQMVSKLVKKGLLIREEDPEKKSRALVTATPRGRTAQANHMAFHSRHDKPFFAYLAQLNEDQYLVFDDLCTRMDLWMGSYLDSDEH